MLTADVYEILVLPPGDPRFEQILATFTGQPGIEAELDAKVADEPGKRWWVALAGAQHERAGDVAGFCAAVEGGQEVFLANLYVAPEHRRQGLGWRLFTQRLAFYPRQVLRGFCADGSLPFYRRAGVFTELRDGISGTGHHWTEVLRPAA